MDDDLSAIREKKLRDMMSEIGKAKDDTEWPGEPIAVTDSNFQSTAQKYAVLVVDCWAPWCGPCRMIAPTIDALAIDYKGKAAFGKLNTDENTVTAQQYGIMSIPTLLFFKNGELADRLTGAVPREYIEDKLKKLV